jgi:hypothetical protein
MAIRTPKLKLPLLMLVVSTLALSAGAQSAGQAIIFTTPQTDAGSPDKSSLASVNSRSGELPGTLQAPVQFFDFDPPSDRPPAPASPGISPQQQRMQNLLNERKNWILMTPEEILGVATTEKMLQPPERDALGREKNPTPLERFLQRESQARNGLTNGWHDGRIESPWNITHDQDNAKPPDSDRSSPGDSARNLSEVLNGLRNREAAADQKGNSGWDALSQNLPQATTKPEPEQLAAMERFRQLLNPSPDETAQPSTDGRLVSAPKLAVDPFLMRPDFVPNPVGASFIPLDSGIARPTGLTPLPDAVTSLLPSVAVPSWKTQPPPWLLPGPQPFVIPQRKGF